MHIGDKIKKIRKENKLTQKELAKILDIKPTAVSAWELGRNKPLMDKLELMSDRFNVPISYFFDDEDINNLRDKTYVPIYGYISCGNGTVIYEPTTEYERVPSDWIVGGEFFFLRAQGDSMVGANIQEGDLLLIRQQEVVENGEIAAVVIDDEVVLKRVYKQNGVFTLISENPKYPPRVFHPGTDKNIRIIGRLCKSITEY